MGSYNLFEKQRKSYKNPEIVYQITTITATTTTYPLDGKGMRADLEEKRNDERPPEERQTILSPPSLSLGFHLPPSADADANDPTGAVFSSVKEPTGQNSKGDGMSGRRRRPNRRKRRRRLTTAIES